MNRLIKAGIIPLVVAALLQTSVANAAGQATVDVGTASSFALLAGTGISNTGSSVITGNIGSFSTTTITGFPPGVLTAGSINHAGDSVTQGAKTDLTTAFGDAAGRTPVTTVATELGSTTKNAGVYNSLSGTFGITGALTLDAQNDPSAVFIFKTASTLVTAAGSTVVLTGGAQACNVFWEIGSSATLGANSILKGSMLVFTSATLTTGAAVEGRILARNGAVTLDTNIVTTPTCAATPTPTPSPTATPSSSSTATPTATPTSAASNAATSSSVPSASTVPTLPNTGSGPEESASRLNIIIPVGILISALLLYVARRKRIV